MQASLRRFRAKIFNTQGNPNGQSVHDQWAKPTGFGINQGAQAQGFNNPWTPNSSPVAMCSSFGAGRSLHKDVTYVIDKKNTEGLGVFSGKVVDYERWVERFIEHLSSKIQGQNFWRIYNSILQLFR